MVTSCSCTTHGFVPLSPHPQTHYKPHNFPSQFLSSNSSLSSTNKLLLPSGPRNRKSHSICALQSNVFKVVQTVFKIGKDGVEAGTNLVPNTVPRPIAKLSVTAVATVLSLFVFRSFVSTVFFAVGFMGFVYFVYLALNKDNGPKVDEKPGSTDEALDQARKIMDKYR